MRIGKPWRLAVLASLALLVSGQLCMLTTCVPRLHQPGRMAAHACCRTTPATSAPSRPAHVPGSMPCDIMLHSADAPVLTAAQAVAAMAGDRVPALAPPARASQAAAAIDTGPPHQRLAHASAGLRAPPQA